MKKKKSPMVRLTKEQIRAKQHFIKSYMSANNGADGSDLDKNANIVTKTVATLGYELNKDINIQVNRQTIYDYIEGRFGQSDADEYINLIESHVLYKNDESSQTPGTPYCASISMYPFLEHGMTNLGGESKAPKHLESFCGSFNNLVFAVSSQFAGAVATVEFLLYFHYFAVKDYGQNYLNTHKETIEAKLQHVIYTLNQPAAARGYQSVFFNLSVFDRYYFDSMFGNFYFPDGTHIEYDEFNEFQKFFMKWLCEERTHSLLTFPVLTEASLDENYEPKDKEWANFCAEMRAEGLSFFSFNDTSASALSSCCVTDDSVIDVIDSDKNNIQLTIKDFCEKFIQFIGEKRVNTQYTVLSFNPFTEQLEERPITGVLAKHHYGCLYEFNLNGKTLKCTPDHKLTLKDKDTLEIITVDAAIVANNPDKYLLPVM